ncbi:hypothetical protein COY25_00020 [Candidatus Uhrbacteria bacterium CG_4_10_14_0_2_um_filter_41_7]|uniref:DUF192 domain-containing protein n=1 Tax=Candidatus Uhrbacteria bacterium CG_4_9_14_3_um_filter_41_35 TaxID=1975034 RepID=A0A2M7XDM6_9BACT|nr:MAG: hypothetical protein COV92_03030 [Candidatus Uhrbacteria bacterium CG11_big_fil_rev_8_21_14_0_20_41_9]PIZ55913.1 MAG: hypothetical protein COY25_00020 [Candidatus Uhrbacteria bacterium CG_4_10_14_0_2_um_filter_41_7]PJA45987.1 MAG: hypothetical protein CO173_03880 [Candidatus Uhrbacteria bacterium CG_4_9_14_3_um_filter_41_35]
MKNSIVLIVLALCVGAVVTLGFLSSSPKTTKTMKVAGENILVYVASDPIQQTRGLSGTKIETLGADGMVFLFKNKEERTFWMKDMNYDLDIVWIANDKVVKMERNIPAPHGEEPQRMKSMPYSVDTVLELPAGGIDKFGIVPGAPVVLPGLLD